MGKTNIASLGRQSLIPSILMTVAGVTGATVYVASKSPAPVPGAPIEGATKVSPLPGTLLPPSGGGGRLPPATSNVELVGKKAGPTRFIKGVWMQVPATHAIWKARGVNTLVISDIGNDHPGYGFTEAQYNASAAANGLKQIRDPGSNGAADLNDPSILAWNLPDEPDLTNVPAAQLDGTISKWQAAYGGLKPIALNLTMYHVAGMWGRDNYLNLARVDWFGGDTYPDQAYVLGVPSNLMSGFILGGSRWMSTVSGMGISNMFRGPYNGGIVASFGKAMFAYISTSHTQIFDGDDQPVQATRPRTNRLQAWSSIINGAAGIKVFPQTVGVMTVTGSVSGNTLTVSAVPWTKFPNRIYTDGAGLKIVGAGIADAKIVAQLSGTPGSVGTYSLSGPPQAFGTRKISLVSGTRYGSSDDDSTTGNLAELAVLFKNVDVLERLGGNLLMDTVNGGRKKYDFWRSWDYWQGNPNGKIDAIPEPALSGQAWLDNYQNKFPWQGATMPRGFEAAVFKGSDGRTYYLVLNLTDAKRTLNFTAPALPNGVGAAPWKVTNMSFDRFEAKLFTDSDQTNLLAKAGVDD